MTTSLPHSVPARQRRVQTLRHGWRRLQDHLMLNVYGGLSPEDIERYQNQPDTLAGLIATRTGRSRERIRELLVSAFQPWRHA